MRKWVAVLIVSVVMAGCALPLPDESSSKTSFKDSEGNKFSTSEKGFKMEGANGDTMSFGGAAVTEAQLGLPFYPGSVAVAGGDMQMETKEGQSYTSARTTTDDAYKVADFYKSKLTNPTEASSGGITVQGLMPNRRKATIMINQEGTTVNITVNVETIAPTSPAGGAL